MPRPPRSRLPRTEAAPVEVAEVAEEPAAEAPGPDPALVASGEKVFRKCKACHQVGDGAKNRTGPLLNGVVGREIASVEGFRYSNPFKDRKAEGFVWDHDTLSAYLADPKGYLPGNKMAFKGLNSDDDIAAVIAYLRSFGG